MYTAYLVSLGKICYELVLSPKYTAQTDQLYFGYETVNHDIQMQNVLHFVTVFIVCGAKDQVP